ncbi:hypothetical protein GCM10012275_36350 [Longimycelium tulufanense]|uniref:Activator of Hsp90 ATPase homologue 1/2-like C-terminal domain-containing protein n=1 Tax=Longimycelium tulufanense TaxID=907463 RepID=A0A8J3C9W5_9PSEU|nr:SRPBCC domain-containing protein [Longimycelium tulufanense]GGM62342.1 hypothetical protein GCM10012275_36350 [Longimycelium tulufanense]
MSPSAREPAPTGSGMVRVTRRVVDEPGEVWAALREPERLARWFGDLDRPLASGVDTRFEFGDGDFFTVRPHRVREGELLEFDWRFLGVGPVNHIRWRVEPAPGGTLVHVEDRDATRSPAEVAQMVDGWTDFLERLAEHLSTGRTTRYGCRDDIDGLVDLPKGPFRPLGGTDVYRWLPVASDGFGPRWFFVVDDQGPRRFPLHDWNLLVDERLTFTVGIPEVSVRPSCAVQVRSIGSSSLRLSFTHTGWASLGLPVRRARELRHRFADTWIAALRGAREHAGERSADK